MADVDSEFRMSNARHRQFPRVKEARNGHSPGMRFGLFSRWGGMIVIGGPRSIDNTYPCCISLTLASLLKNRSRTTMHYNCWNM
ncbi:hypothetical protein IG631_06924 [Alternaria alternata]|nr:hypothetical protein IG631_06924 [Alternaria alternata]